MIDVAVEILKLALGSFEKLSSILKSQEKSKKEELCYVLYRSFENIDDIIKVSERLLSKLPEIERTDIRIGFCKDQEEIAQLIANMRHPLLSLSMYMRIADPDIENRIKRAFGSKLELLLFLAKVSPVLSEKSKKRTLKILKKVNFDKLPFTPHEMVTAKQLSKIQQSGAIEVDSLDVDNTDHIDFVLRRGQLNISELKKLRSDIRSFMINNFEKEDFFFSKIHRYVVYR